MTDAEADAACVKKLDDPAGGCVCPFCGAAGSASFTPHPTAYRRTQPVKGFDVTKPGLLHVRRYTCAGCDRTVVVAVEDGPPSGAA